MPAYYQQQEPSRYPQPCCQDLRVYWVWSSCEEEDAQRRVESVGITSKGAGAGKIAGNLVLEPQDL